MSSAGRHDLKFGGDFHYIPISTPSPKSSSADGSFSVKPFRSRRSSTASLGAGTSANVAAGLAASGRADLIPNLSVPITSLQSFNFGLPSVYQQGFGDPRAELTNKILSGYIQDNFKAASNLTVNLGLRYDLELQPNPIHRDKNNFGPGSGLPTVPDPRTVVRGGYGIYYAPLFEAVAFVGRVLEWKSNLAGVPPIDRLGRPWQSRDVGAGVGACATTECHWQPHPHGGGHCATWTGSRCDAARAAPRYIPTL